MLRAGVRTGAALCACGRALASRADLTGLTLVRSVEKPIERYTSIFVESPIHVKLGPAGAGAEVGPGSAGAGDRLEVQLYTRGDGHKRDVAIKQTSKRLELVNSASVPEADDDVCVLLVPPHLNLHVSTTNGAGVEMCDLHAEDVFVNTVRGGIHLGQVLAKSIKAESAEGDVSSEGKLRASTIDLKTGATSGIDCNNILSNAFTATTHAGTINIKACYSDNSHFTTAMGDIKLDHLHRNCIIDIIQRGNLHISGFEGQLQASLKSGNVFMHASKLTEKSSIFIHEKGKVQMRISELIKAFTIINLIADKIDVDEEIKKLGRYMDDSHPQRFRYPLQEESKSNELHVECRNGMIELKQTNFPFMIDY